MSDMLQLVVEVVLIQCTRNCSMRRHTNTPVDESDDKLKRIGHSLSNFDSVECGCE